MSELVESGFRCFFKSRLGGGGGLGGFVVWLCGLVVVVGGLCG